MACNHCGYDHPMEPCHLPTSHVHSPVDWRGSCTSCYALFVATMPTEATLREAVEYLSSTEGRRRAQMTPLSDTVMEFELYNRAGRRDAFRLERLPSSEPPVAKGQMGWVDESA